MASPLGLFLGCVRVCHRRLYISCTADARAQQLMLNGPYTTANVEECHSLDAFRPERLDQHAGTLSWAFQTIVVEFLRVESQEVV